MASIALRLKSDPKAIIVKTLSYASSHFFSSGLSSPYPPPGQTQNGESTQSNATENAQSDKPSFSSYFSDLKSSLKQTRDAQQSQSPKSYDEISKHLSEFRSQSAPPRMSTEPKEASEDAERLSCWEQLRMSTEPKEDWDPNIRATENGKSTQSNATENATGSKQASKDAERLSAWEQLRMSFGPIEPIEEWDPNIRGPYQKFVPTKFELAQGYYDDGTKVVIGVRKSTNIKSVEDVQLDYPRDPLLSNGVIIKESTSENPDKRDELMVTTGDRVHDPKQEKLAPNKEKNVVSKKKSKSSKEKGKGKLISVAEELREASEEITDQLSNCNTDLTGVHEQASRKDPVISVTEACVRVRRVEGVTKKQLSYIFIVLIDPNQREALQNMLDDEEIKEWVYHHYFARYGDE